MANMRVALLVVVTSFMSLGMPLPELGASDDCPNSEQLAVSIDGQPFTVFFIGGANLNRPYLYPLRSASGKIVTRSFPAGQLPGETTDHPHHAGLFYGHGDVNGYNYWAIQNVPAPASPLGATMGRIVLARVLSVKGGKESGSVDTVFNWLKPDGQPLLTETRKMIFYSHPTLRIIDFGFDFAAVDKVVSGTPRKAPSRFVSRRRSKSRRSSRATARAAPARTGKLTSATGGGREAGVWGKRASWVDYSGELDGEKVGVLMMDHPGNPRHPTYWHSRGYGLHSINPFGVSDFLNDKSQNGSLTLAPGEHVRFRYASSSIKVRRVPDAMSSTRNTRERRPPPRINDSVIPTNSLGACARAAATVRPRSTVKCEPLLIRQLPYRDRPEAHRPLFEADAARRSALEAVAPASFIDWRQRARTIEVMAAAEPFGFTYTSTSGSEPQSLPGVRVTQGFFDAFGMDAMCWPTFTPDEYTAGRNRVVVLSHGTWTRHFGGDRGIVGGTIRLNGQPHTVVGIMPPTFAPRLLSTFTERGVWAPKVLSESERQLRESPVLQHRRGGWGLASPSNRRSPNSTPSPSGSPASIPGPAPVGRSGRLTSRSPRR